MNLLNGLVRAATVTLLLGVESVMAVEEAEYEVLRVSGDFEIREYAPSLLAEVVVNEDFEDAGNAAFRPLFKYIDGNNKAQQEIAMTAPVGQQKTSPGASQKIAMTAPVSQSASPEGWTVSFMMPAEFTMENIPLPEDPRVQLREVPAWRAAALRYSGTWSVERYEEHLVRLRQWVANEGLEVTGEPVWARYNAPFTPWFLRRNEILLPIGSG